MSKLSSQQKQRHRARRLAMQALYQWHYNQLPSEELVATTLKDMAATKFDHDYFEILLIGTLSKLDEIDEAITPVLDRKFAELNPVELAILRVASFEMLHRIEIPYRVIINEGIELAKEFGSEQGHRYVNGVLDKLASQYRSVEFTS